ncbi:hypothetical protein GCM10028773_27320 [Spirosoma koreense]
MPQGKEEDYSVYAALIDQNCSGQSSQKATMVIASKTVKPFIDDWKVVLQDRQLSQLTTNPDWQQFLTTLDSSRFSTLSLTGGIPSACFRTQILTDEQWTYYFGPSAPGRGLDGLRTDFPGFSSLLSFSSVVYSADGKKAICCRSAVCGGLCGSGEVYFLERRTAGWTIVESSLLWIS